MGFLFYGTNTKNFLFGHLPLFYLPQTLRTSLLCSSLSILFHPVAALFGLQIPFLCSKVSLEGLSHSFCIRAGLKLSLPGIIARLVSFIDDCLALPLRATFGELMSVPSDSGFPSLESFSLLVSDPSLFPQMVPLHSSLIELTLPSSLPFSARFPFLMDFLS